jgi:hypothetical protein
MYIKINCRNIQGINEALLRFNPVLNEARVARL